MIALRNMLKLKAPSVRYIEIKPAVERYLLFLTVFVMVIAALFAAIHALSPNSAASAGTIRVIVHKGDNLWTYASKYGNPDEYILRRVHKIAKINNLEVNRPLEPGQELIIPCGRKTVCASNNGQIP